MAGGGAFAVGADDGDLMTRSDEAVGEGADAEGVDAVVVAKEQAHSLGEIEPMIVGRFFSCLAHSAAIAVVERSSKAHVGPAH